MNRITLSDGSFYPSIPDLCHCKGRNGCSSIVFHKGIIYSWGHHVNVINPMKNSISKNKSVESRKDRTVSQETKNKISKNHRDMKGPKNHMYGKVSYGFKQFKYQSPLQGFVHLRSFYEYSYAQYLDNNKILWMYEMETFPLSDEMTYTPDFFLIKENKFVEIKGWMRPKHQLKVDKFREEYPWDLEILFGKDLLKLGLKLRK